MKEERRIASSRDVSDLSLDGGHGGEDSSLAGRSRSSRESLLLVGVLGDLLKSGSVGSGSRSVSSHVGKVHGDEDNLRVGLSSHGSQGVKSSDAHGGRGGEDIGSSPHESSSVNLGPSGDDLGLSNSLGLGSGRERLLKVLREQKILDEDRLNADSPVGSRSLDDLLNLSSDSLSLGNDVLESPGTDDVSKGGLGSLDEGSSNVGDSVGGLVRGGNRPTDDGLQIDVDVILGHDLLSRDGIHSDSNIDDPDGLSADVDVDKSRVDGLVELSEPRDESDVSLSDRSERVGEGAAGDGTT